MPTWIRYTISLYTIISTFFYIKEIYRKWLYVRKQHISVSYIGSEWATQITFLFQLLPFQGGKPVDLTSCKRLKYQYPHIGIFIVSIYAWMGWVNFFLGGSLGGREPIIPPSRQAIINFIYISSSFELLWVYIKNPFIKKAYIKNKQQSYPRWQTD